MLMQVQAIRRVYQAAMMSLPTQIPVTIQYRRAFGHFPNLSAPETFNEKVQRRKVKDRDPRLPARADKVLVKQFVGEKLGEGWVIPTIWHGARLPPVAERTWPIPFVVKANHGSTWNLFVRSEAERDWPTIESRCAAWLGKYFGISAGEWHYAAIRPQILIEPFVGELSQLPIDYKLWVFHGRVEFVQIDTDRETDHKRAFYDREWRRLPFELGYPLETRDVPRPASLSEMIRGAEALAEDLPFVRVDFYEINGCPLFGEMTFFPGSGWERFSPPEWDAKIGALWR
jgi:hypothetical protein